MNKQNDTVDLKNRFTINAVWGCLRGTEAVIDEAGQKEQDWYFFGMAML